MARLPLRALRRALTPNTDPKDDVHFHRGPQGLPAVCYDRSCPRPRLDVE